MASVASEDGDHVSLNVMPMLDIFSILILFLLMSFSTEPVSHDLNEGVELPYSETLVSLDEIPLIMMTPKTIYLNDQEIEKIDNGKLRDGSVSQGAIENLFIELEKFAEMNERYITAKNKDKPLSLTIEIDKNHEFSLIKKAMLAAQMAGFFTFKLMVSKRI